MLLPVLGLATGLALANTTDYQGTPVPVEPYSYDGDVPTGVYLTPYDKVILMNQQPDTYYYAIEANQACFEDFMNGGGCLEMGTANYFGGAGPTITWPGSFSPTEVECINTVDIVDPTHPLFNDPMPVGLGDLTGWDCSSHGDYVNVPDNASVLVTKQGYVYDTPVCYEFCYGAGADIASNQPMDWIGPTNPYAINLVLCLCEGGTPAEETSWSSLKALFK